MNLSYFRNGHYDVPSLTLLEQPEPTYGKYGRMRKRYLQVYRALERFDAEEDIAPMLAFLERETVKACERAAARAQTVSDL